MTDPVSAILEFILKQSPTGVACFICGAWGYKKFFNKQLKPSVNGKYVREELCLERGRRVGDDIDRLQKADDKHLVFQKENTGALHLLDKNIAKLMAHHKVDPEKGERHA